MALGATLPDDRMNMFHILKRFFFRVAEVAQLVAGSR
jgi:hypothetical protein